MTDKALVSGSVESTFRDCAGINAASSDAKLIALHAGKADEASGVTVVAVGRAAASHTY